MAREIVIPYKPRPIARRFHDNPARFIVLVWHRRAGKTVSCVNHLQKGTLSCPLPRPRFAYIAPLYRQAKEVAWDYLKHYSASVPAVSVNESELRVDYPNSGRIKLFGADNPDALRGQYFDGVVLDEYPQMNPRVWTEIVRPALSDRRGWAVFIGTPKGRNSFCELFENAMWGRLLSTGERYMDADWWGDMQKASQTGILPQEELDSARREMSEDEYAQEYECSFQAALVGAYYGKHMAAAEEEGRICSVPYEPRLPVWTGWDLGIDDSTTIWFVQVAGREIRVIDYYEASGVGLEHYAKVLREKPYTYEPLQMPHDVEVRELSTGKSRAAVLKGFGFDVRVVPKISVPDGIQAVRNILPRCWFDREKCGRGLEALRQYQKEWDPKMQTFRPTPRHDWASHGADGFRYLALGLKEKQPDEQQFRDSYNGMVEEHGWMGM